MPENVFRLLVVGLLFMVLSVLVRNPEDIFFTLSAIMSWLVGSGFVICGFIAWIGERQESQRRREALQ